MPFGNSPARLPVPEGQTAIAQRFIAGFGRAGDMSPGGTKEGSFLHRWLIAVTLSSLRDLSAPGRGPSVETLGLLSQGPFGTKRSLNFRKALALYPDSCPARRSNRNRRLLLLQQA